MEPPAECQVEIKTERSWRIRPILGKDLTDDVPLEEAYVASLKNKQLISKAIGSISAALPGFNYLKRCNGSKLLLARTLKVPDQKTIINPYLRKEMPGEILPKEELREMLIEKGFDMDLIEDEFEVVKIPCKPAKTKDQAKSAGAIWPLNFHPDLFIEDIIQGAVFDDKLLNIVEEFIRIVMDAAKMGSVGTKDCCGSTMIVDPNTGRVLSLAAARVDRHPMWHSTMLAVDLVARLQGEGAWYLAEEEAPADVEYITPDEPLDQNEINSSSNGFWKIGRVTKRKYKEGETLFYPECLNKIKLPEPMQLETKRKKKKPKKVKEDGTEEVDPRKLVGPYLCTGYWAFLLQEPCALCAMALLHSRVAKIFYGAPNTKAGVLGSKAVLHALPGLNHRYQVWCGILEKECIEIVQNSPVTE